MSLRKSAFKIFFLKYVKNTILYSKKMKNWLLDSMSIQMQNNYILQKRMQFSRGT